MGKYIFLQSHQFAKMCQPFSDNGAAIQMNGGRRGFKIIVPFTADTTAGIRKAQTAFGALNKIEHSMTYSTKTKLCIFNTNVKAVQLYGFETWKN